MTAAPPPPAGAYGAYRGQKVIVANVTNIVDRPLYIMAIDKAGETAVKANTPTVVNNRNISVTVTIPANAVVDDKGQLYTGPISVSPVPPEFTPAALPDNLDPSRVLTIQPMGLTFRSPAPIRFPNTDNLEPDSEVNIWSLDHELGKFFIAGKGKVSADRKWIDTTEGGIRESSWHFILALLLDAVQPLFDNNRTCPATNQNPQHVLADGCALSAIQLPGYLSQGEQRPLALSYISQRAWPSPILPFQATLPLQAAVPDAISYELRSFGGITGKWPSVLVRTDTLQENRDETFRGAVAVGGVGGGSALSSSAVAANTEPLPTS